MHLFAQWRVAAIRRVAAPSRVEVINVTLTLIARRRHEIDQRVEDFEAGPAPTRNAREEGRPSDVGMRCKKFGHARDQPTAAESRRNTEAQRTSARRGGGCYIAPTLFTDAKQSMRVAREEIFGPVLTAISFKDEAEALAIANDVDYGLTGYVWTSDVTRALRFTERLEAGMIWVNSENIRHLPTPFGGVKNSGIGRDGGDWSFDFYMETKNIAFATTPHKVPQLGG